MWENDLFDEMRRIRADMDRVFFGMGRESGRFRTPVFNFRETETNLIAEVEMPGITKDDVELNVTKDSIEVKAEKKSEKREQRKQGYYYSASSSAFYRRMSLPVEVKPEHVKATFRNGLLRVEMPKDKTAKKKVRVQ